MADPAPAPDPTPAPSSAPVPSPVPVPGYKTSEAWLTLFTIVIGAIPSSGLVDNAPLLAKIVGMAIAALAAIHYTAQRTALKRAYVAAQSGAPAPKAAKLPIAAAGAAIVIAAAVAIFATSCGGTNCQDPKNAQSAQCVVEGAIVDCTGVSSLSSAVAVAEPQVDKLIASAIQADGSINFASIESQLVALALQYGGCTIAEIWNHYMNGAPAGSGAAVKTAVASKDKAAFAAAFDRIRARVAPGYKFKTSGGTL